MLRPSVFQKYSYYGNCVKPIQAEATMINPIRLAENTIYNAHRKNNVVLLIIKKSTIEYSQAVNHLPVNS